MHAYRSGYYQVRRQLQALLADLVQFVPTERIQTVEYHQKRVETAIAQSFPDPEDQSSLRKRIDRASEM